MTSSPQATRRRSCSGGRARSIERCLAVRPCSAATFDSNAAWGAGYTPRARLAFHLPARRCNVFSAPV